MRPLGALPGTTAAKTGQPTCKLSSSGSSRHSARPAAAAVVGSAEVDGQGAEFVELAALSASSALAVVLGLAAAVEPTAARLVTMSAWSSCSPLARTAERYRSGGSQDLGRCRAGDADLW
jgi:hypothetical protein